MPHYKKDDRGSILETHFEINTCEEVLTLYREGAQKYPDAYKQWEAQENSQSKAVLVPIPATGTAPLAFDASTLPSMTVIAVQIETGAVYKFVADELEEAITLQDPGKYRLIVDPPFPNVGYKVDLELS